MAGVSENTCTLLVCTFK